MKLKGNVNKNRTVNIYTAIDDMHLFFGDHGFEYHTLNGYFFTFRPIFFLHQGKSSRSVFSKKTVWRILQVFRLDHGCPNKMFSYHLISWFIFTLTFLLVWFPLIEVPQECFQAWDEFHHIIEDPATNAFNYCTAFQTKESKRVEDFIYSITFTVCIICDIIRFGVIHFTLSSYYRKCDVLWQQKLL